MNYPTIRQAILTGTLDNHLTQLATDLRTRKQALANNHGHEFRPGDTVTVSGLRPQYINGQEAAIIQINRTRAVVRFNNPLAAGRFADQEVTVPLANMQLVSSGEAAPSAGAPADASDDQTMHEGTPVNVPNFAFDWREQDKWFNEYSKIRQIISFPVADNYAHYEVRGNTLHHIPIGDAYRAHPALLRGITKREVEPCSSAVPA